MPEELQEQLAAGRDLFRRTRTIIDAHVADLVAQAEQAVARYDGLPVRFNPLRVLQLDGHELMHSRLLRWLLDPRESHGLGDGLLRTFLARSGTATGARLAHRSAPLSAVVQNEVPIEGGRIDIVAVTHCAVLSIEVKVWDTEGTDSVWKGRTMSQTETYRVQMDDATVRDHVLRRMGPEAGALAGDSPTTLPYFVCPRGAAPALDPETRNLDWLMIERDLSAAMRERGSAPEARQLLDSFRSLLLEHSGAIKPVMPDIEALRRLVDLPRVRPTDPLATLLQLRALDVEPTGETDG